MRLTQSRNLSSTQTAGDAASGPDWPGSDVTPKRQGRPILLPRPLVLERIRRLAGRPAGLFRVHLKHGGLYARARRLFGTWEAALAAAGVDYRRVMEHSRRRSVRTRKRRGRERRGRRA